MCPRQVIFVENCYPPMSNHEIAALREEFDQVGDVAEQIDVIAAPTNLLALNATFETARAGDGGERASVDNSLAVF